MSVSGGSTYFDGIKITKQQKAFMFLMVAGTFIEQIDLYNFAMLAPALIQVWGLSTAQVGYIHGAYAVGAVLGCLFFGWLADKKGRRIAMVSSLGIAGIAAIFAAFAPNVYFLAAVRVVSGFGIVGAFMVEPAYLVEMVPSDKRSKYQGLIFTISILGIPLAVILAKAVFAIDISYWRYVAAIPGIALIISIIFSIKVPESPRWLISSGRIEEGKKVFKDITGQELRIDPDTEGVVEKATYGDALKIMFSKKYMRRTVLFLSLWVILQNTGYMFMQWLPTLLIKEGMELAQATTYQQAASLSILLGPVYIALFGDKGGRKIPFAIAVLVVGAGLFGISLAGVTNHNLLMVSVLIGGSLYVANQMFNQIYSSECYPTRVRVIVASLLGMSQKIVQILAVGVVAAKLYAGVGFSAYFRTLSIVYVAMAILILVLGIRTSGRTLEELNSITQIEDADIQSNIRA